MLGEILEEIKAKYRDCINPETGRGVFDEIDSRELESEIREILRTAPQNDVPGLEEADLFAIGDVHGDYKTYLKFLLEAGLVDRDGDVVDTRGKKKKLVTSGDDITCFDPTILLDRDKNGLKSLLIMLAVQHQAKSRGLEVTNILGNHEEQFLFVEKGTKMAEYLKGKGFSYGQQMGIKQVLERSIREGDFKLSYAENERNLFFTHAGVEKIVLAECVKQILASRGIEIPPELKQVKEYEFIGRKLEFVERDGKKEKVEGERFVVKMNGVKIKSEALYGIMNAYNITPENISDFMNSKFKMDLDCRLFKEANLSQLEKDKLYAKGDVIEVDDSFSPVAVIDQATSKSGKAIPPVFVLENTPPAPPSRVPFKPTATSVMWTTKKIFRGYLGSPSNPKDLKAKMVQVTGHNPTTYLRQLIPGKGAIKRIGNTFLIDFGGGFEIFINPENGRRDMNGLESAGFLAMTPTKAFSIEFNYESKKWERHDEYGATLPRNGMERPI